MTVEYREGWRPGLIGWCVAEHGRYYAEAWGFTRFFEAQVAEGMAEFSNRLDAPENHLFWAGDAEGFLGTVTLDGGDSEGGLAHLRWFIVSGRARGQGIGGRLLSDCVARARSGRALGLYLTTFSGLDAARSLYETVGFRLVGEAEGRNWGTSVMEQRFEMRF